MRARRIRAVKAVKEARQLLRCDAAAVILPSDLQSAALLPERDVDDSALRLGSAVHALLELFGENQPIPEDRFGSICAFYELASEDRARVRDAVDRYRGSALAAGMAAHQIVVLSFGNTFFI